jgi:hypothetical protein
MSDVVELDDHRPHVVLNDSFGKKTHVAPVAMLQKIVSGELLLSQCDDADSMARAIIHDWLDDRGC